ncbi:MAG: sulfite exporter TauE/SafE family protein [Myxococcales bacterium]|nr:MAG: sulfite exporter TauE/SafE family protein [Myxococcales bacterium]
MMGTRMFEFDVALSASGFLVGLLIGLTGVGGGAVMTPLLILLFGVRPTMAVGTDLAYATITKIFGSAAYIRRGQVNFPYIRWLVVGSVPGALVAVFVLTPWLDRSGVDVETMTTRMLGWMLLAVGVISILERRFFEGALRDSAIIRSHAVQRRFKEPILVIGGLLIGVGVGLTSVGSGSLLMAVLLLVSELNILVLIGTDIVHATILLATAGCAHLIQGNVDIGLAAALLVGSIPGIWAGSRLAQVVPTTPLRYALAVLLAATGFKLAFF